MIFASIYSQELQLSIENVNEQHGSFDLLFDTQVDVQGFELNINGVEIISGESEYFNYINTMNDGFVIGFSTEISDGNPAISANTSGVLVSLQYHLSDGIESLCIDPNTIEVISSDLSEISDLSLGNCHEISWNGVTLSFGDVSVFQQGDDYMRKLDINYASYHDIPGFQMNVDGITLHDAYSEDVIMEINEDDGIILGYST